MIQLPNMFELRDYQVPVWNYFSEGGTRAVSVWHRRAGKDMTAIHRTCVEAHKRVGTYWHMLPQANQARKVIWDGIVHDEDDNPRKIIDWAFPPEIRAKTNQQEMKIELKCGSVWQLCGSDNYDALVGSNPIGVIMSEYSVAKPSAWDYIRPILAENSGWAWFIYTPRGRNHGYDLYMSALDNPDWHAEILTVADTGVVSEEAIEAERRAGMLEDMLAQEFYCSFEGAMVGSYYAKCLTTAMNEGRLTRVPYDPILPVHTAWDLGISDISSIWFFQTLRTGEIRAIDYHEDSGEGLQHYAKVLAEKQYIYEHHYGPHDIMVREMGTGKSRYEVAENLGIEFDVVPAMSPEDRVQAVRNILPRCWFDVEKCKGGILALREYRREYDEVLHTYKSRPLHNWASHGADAFGHFAVGHVEEQYSREDEDMDAWRNREIHDGGRSRVGGY